MLQYCTDGPTKVPVSSVSFNKEHFNMIVCYSLQRNAVFQSAVHLPTDRVVVERNGRKWPLVELNCLLLNNTEKTDTYLSPYNIVRSVAMG